MWLALARGATQNLELSDRQSIWPAPDGTDAELVITAQARLHQEVVVATPRVIRLRYRIDALDAAMAIEPAPPAPWPEASAVSGHGFEVMITERGAIVVPAPGEKLPNRQAVWLATVAEDVRCAWSVPPDHAAPGMTWRGAPSVPGGLPPATKSATFDVAGRVDRLEGALAQVVIDFAVHLVMETTHPARGEGQGTVHLAIHREHGIEQARRDSALHLAGPEQRREVLRSSMRLICRTLP